MTFVGWLGVGMLCAGILAIVIEGILAGIWARRITRSANLLNRLIESERALMSADAKRLQRALAETRILWQPYRRALRWLRHPLTVALIRSYTRGRVSGR